MEIKKLTRAEEEVMQILWKLKKGFVRDILEQMEAPKPAYNTVSTIVRILEKKGFVDYEAFGKTHRYFPLVKKENYLRMTISEMKESFFEGSANKMVSFFVKENNISAKDLDEILKIIEKAKRK